MLIAVFWLLQVEGKTLRALRVFRRHRDDRQYAGVACHKGAPHMAVLHLKGDLCVQLSFFFMRQKLRLWV